MQLPQGALSGAALRDSVSSLYPVLERYAKQRFGVCALTAGWQDFSRWGQAAIAHEKDSYQLAFTAWWLFAWMPDDQHLQGESFLALPPDHAIAADYLALHRTNLSLLEQRVTKRALTSPHSFYTLLSIEADNRFRLQEIYTQKQVMVEVDVNTRFATGDVLFTAVLSVDGVSILLGCMPFALGATSQPEIEAHREKWRADVGKAIDKRLLYLHDTELRRYYFLLLSRVQQVSLH